MSADDVPGIPVTSAMVDAGLAALFEYSFGEDIRYVLESVYRAMAYESLAVASTKDVK